MAESSIPPSCDPTIFELGTEVFGFINPLPPESLERWVKDVERASGERVDWHPLGATARILGLGDLHKIRVAMYRLMDDFEQMYRQAMRNKSRGATIDDADIPVPRPKWWNHFSDAN